MRGSELPLTYLGRCKLIEKLRFYDIQFTVRLNPLNWGFRWDHYSFGMIYWSFGPLGCFIFFGDRSKERRG